MINHTSLQATHRVTWFATSAIAWAVACGLVLAALGVLTSRVDLVLLALPLWMSAALAIDQRPTDGAESTTQVDIARHAHADGSSRFAYRVAIETPTGAELVHVRITPQHAPVYELVLAAGKGAVVTGALPVVHSGRQRVVDVLARLIGGSGAWMSLPLTRQQAERVIDPAIVPLPPIPLPHRLTGLTGAHGSARPGDGGEFRDLHPYAAGDRLRRIDWKATARRSQGFGDLYVRRTDATSDATVVLMIDSHDEIGEHVSSWSANASDAPGLTSMDVAREAAASLAVAAISAGDRVSLIDLATYDGVVAAGSGKRHLDRVLRRLAVSVPLGTRLSRHRAPIVPAGAIVYLITTFLDDHAASSARLWRAAGHRVIGVDVLPAPIADGSPRHTRIAHRLLMAERRQRMAQMRANGLELFRWQEGAPQPHRAVALRQLARAGRRRT